MQFTSIDEYAQHLKKHFRKPHNDGLPTLSSNVYFELAIINRDSPTRTVETGLANPNDNLTTPLLTLNDILKPGEGGTPVRCVLILGAPGVGKSTLAWEVCHKWAMDKLDRQFNLAILVPLREAQKACGIKDILPVQFVGNLDHILAKIGNGKGLLLVLDGFDELPHEQQEDGSIFINLIKGFKLQEATIIITSRPSVSANLYSLCKHDIDRNLEILGFTGENITKFVTSKLGERAEELVQNPIIKGMMYLPLNAVIIASIFKQSGNSQLYTMTQLFDALTRALIRLHLIRNKSVSADHFIMPRSLQSKKCISDHFSDSTIPEKLYKLLQEAYEGLMRNEYVLTNLSNDFDHLGLMKKTQGSEVSVGNTYTFNYLHTTLQEYLAALHIFYSPDVEVPPSFGKRYVLRFLAGLCCAAQNNDDLCLKVGSLLQNIADNDEHNLQLARCVYESNCIVQKIPMVHKLLSGNGPQPIINVKGEVLFDYYLIGHCVCHIGGQWSITVQSRKEVKYLVKGLKSTREGQESEPGPVGGHIVHELKLWNISFNSLETLLTKCIPLSCLHLYCVTFTKSDVPMLQEYISHDGVLKKIKIVDCKNIDLLLSTLFGPSSLDTVHISGTPSIGSDADTVADTARDLLCCNENLKKLLIDDTIIDLQRLIAVIKSNNTLKELTLFVTETNCSPDYAANKSCFPLIMTDGESDNLEFSESLPTPLSFLEEAAIRKQIKLELQGYSCTFF